MTISVRIRAAFIPVMLSASLAAPVAAVAQSAPAPIAAGAEKSLSAPAQPGRFFAHLVKDLVGDFKRLPSTETATLLSIGAATALFGHEADRPLSAWMSGNSALDKPFEAGNIIGGYQMQLGGAFATYALGRALNKPRVADIGGDLLRANIVSQVITGAVKHSVQRTRPDGTHLSFPSGHTSASFASATVLHQRLGWKVGVPAFAVATYVAAARVQEKRHFLSDVGFGAAIGLVAGRTVTVGRGKAKFAVAPTAVPGGAGVSFALLNQR